MIMKKFKIFSILALGFMFNLILPFQSGYSQDACSRTEYYDGCGDLYWSTGSSSCSNVIQIYMDFECDS